MIPVETLHVGDPYADEWDPPENCMEGDQWEDFTLPAKLGVGAQVEPGLKVLGFSA